jgi:hypothetical protein
MFSALGFLRLVSRADSSAFSFPNHLRRLRDERSRSPARHDYAFPCRRAEPRGRLGCVYGTGSIVTILS